MAEANIDTLQIEIEAESSKAASQVEALANQLERLKNILGGINGNSIINQIKDIGAKTGKATSDIQKAIEQPKPQKRNGIELGELKKDTDYLKDFQDSSEQADKMAEAIQNANEQIDKYNNKETKQPFEKASGTNVEKIQKIIDQAGVNAEKAGNKFNDLQRKIEALEGLKINDLGIETAIKNAKSELKDFETAIGKTKDAVQGLEDLKKRLIYEPMKTSKQDVTGAKEQYDKAKFQEGIAGKYAAEAVAEAKRQASELQKAMGTLGGVINKGETQLNAYAAQALKSAEQLSELKARMSTLESKKGITVFADKGIDSASTKLKELEKAVQNTKIKAKELQDALNAVGAGNKDVGIAKIRELINEYKSANDTVKALGGIAKSAMKDAEKAVSKAEKEIKDGFNKAFKDLQKVDLSSIVDVSKLQSKLSSLGDTMSKLKGVQMLPKEDFDKLANAETKMQDFASAVKTASIISSQLGVVLRGINDGSINMSAQALRDLVDAYKLAKANASAAGEAAKSAMDIAKNAVKSAEKAIKDYNKDLGNAGNVANKGSIDMPKIESQITKLQTKLAELQKIKGIGDIAGPGLQDAVKKVLEFQMAASFAAQELENLKAQIDGIQSGKIQASKEEVEKLADKYKQAKQAAEEYGAGAKAALDKVTEQTKEQKVKPGTDQKEIEKIKKSLERSLQSDVASALPKILDSIKTKAAEMIKVLEKAGQTGWAMALRAAFYIINTAIQSVKSSLDIIKKAFNSIKPAIEKVAKSANKLAKSFASLYTSGIKKIGKGFAGVGKYIVSDFIKPITSAIKTIDTWKRSLGRIAFYRAVRSAIAAVTDGFKTGIENLYQYSALVGTEFKPAMDSLATSALYLKNSLGAMAAPLIQALAPAIDFIVDKFVALLNIIGKVFAALTGKSVYTQAKKHAVEYADAANDASKATKDFVLGIDELNIINESAGAAASAADDFGSMFEEVEVPNDIADWAQQIRDAIERGDWYSVGAIIADKLNEVVDSWDSYAWGQKLGQLINNGLNVAYGFLKTFDFVNLGKKIGEGVMGIFDSIDWDLLGRTFAAKWNALFDFIYGFAKAIRWEDVGKDIADALTGWIDEIDPSKAARAINEFIGGILLAAMNAIENTPWYTLGEKIGTLLTEIDWYTIIHRALSVIADALNALTDIINGVLAKFDWYETALEVAYAINDAFGRVNWRGLGEALSSFVIMSFDFLRETIAHIEWEQIGRDIKEFLMGIRWDDLITSFKSMMTEISNSIKEFANGLIEGFPTELIPKILTVLGIVVQGILSGMLSNKTVLLLEGSAILITIFNEFGDQLKEGAANLANSVNEFFANQDWKKVGEYIGNGIKNALDAAIIFIEGLDWESIWRSITDFLAGVDLFNIFSKLGDIIGTVLFEIFTHADLIFKAGAAIILGLLDGLLSNVPIIGPALHENLFVPLNDALWEGGEESKLVVATSWEDIKSNTNTIWGEMVTDSETNYGEMNTVIGQSLDQTILDVDTKTGEIKTKAGKNFEDVRIDAEDKFGQIKTHIVDNVTESETVANEKMESIKKTSTEAFAEIESEASTKFPSTHNHIQRMMEDSDTDTQTHMDSIKTTSVDAFKEIESEAEDKFPKSQKHISDSWSTAEKDTDTSWGNMWAKISGTLSDIWNNVSSTFSSLVESAFKWGSDLIDNLVDGMDSNRSKASRSASGVASGIRQYIGFSEPEVGPLSDFHTYMPDMMKGLAQGIESNSFMVENAMQNLTSKMSNDLTNMPTAADIGFPDHGNDFKVSHNIEKTWDENQYQDASETLTMDVRNANEDVVNAIYDMATNIISAVETLSDRPVQVSIDRKNLVNQVERGQRERGANIMRGGVNG